MPATGRPNTDYERWLQHHNPDAEFQPSPQYGPHHGSRSGKYPPFHTPKTDRPRIPLAEPQIRFSPTEKELGSSPREGSSSLTGILLFVFVILVAVAYARSQLAHSSHSPQTRRREFPKLLQRLDERCLDGYGSRASNAPKLCRSIGST